MDAIQQMDKVIQEVEAVKKQLDDYIRVTPQEAMSMFVHGEKLYKFETSAYREFYICEYRLNVANPEAEESKIRRYIVRTIVLPDGSKGEEEATGNINVTAFLKTEWYVKKEDPDFGIVRFS